MRLVNRDWLQIASHQEGLPVVDLFTPPFDRVPAADIRRMASYEDTSLILTVIGMTCPSPHSPIWISFAEKRDADSADDRNDLRIDAMRREEQIDWKGLATHIWNWVANPVKSISQFRDSIAIPLKVQQPAFSGSVSTCVPNKANTSGLVHRRQTAKLKVGWRRMRHWAGHSCNVKCSMLPPSSGSLNATDNTILSIWLHVEHM